MIRRMPVFMRPRYKGKYLVDRTHILLDLQIFTPDAGFNFER